MSREDLKEKYRSKKLDTAGLDQMEKHYEEKRKQRLKEVLEARQELMVMEQNGLMTFTATHVSTHMHAVNDTSNESAGKCIRRER